MFHITCSDVHDDVALSVVTVNEGSGKHRPQYQGFSHAFYLYKVRVVSELKTGLFLSAILCVLFMIVHHFHIFFDTKSETCDLISKWSINKMLQRIKTKTLWKVNFVMFEMLQNIRLVFSFFGLN